MACVERGGGVPEHLLVRRRVLARRVADERLMLQLVLVGEARRLADVTKPRLRIPGGAASKRGGRRDARDGRATAVGAAGRLVVHQRRRATAGRAALEVQRHSAAALGTNVLSGVVDIVRRAARVGGRRGESGAARAGQPVLPIREIRRLHRLQVVRVGVVHTGGVERAAR